jgi:hypothetical protein
MAAKELKERKDEGVFFIFGFSAFFCGRTCLPVFAWLAWFVV